MWIRGNLLEEEANIGEVVKIKTLTGRCVSGTLFEIKPTYEHSFGTHVPEIFEIGRSLREILFGGEDDGK